jgi:hypothetical protein
MTGAHTTRTAGVVLTGTALLLLGSAGCSDAPAPLPPPTAMRNHPLAAHDVRVRLEFGAGADLDLFVTDPMHEEVYFANSPSRLGGVFDADRRCDDPAPRIETVRFSPAPAGRYRVSVDFPIRCQPGIEAVPYRVVVEANGEERPVEGTAHFGSLEHTVIEFEAVAR